MATAVSASLRRAARALHPLALRGAAREPASAPAFRALGSDSKQWQKEHLRSPQGGADIPHDLSVRQRRIVYRSKQRGWLELDVLFGGWAVKHVPAMADEKSIAMVEHLLEADTPSVLRWVLNQEQPPPEYDNEVLRGLRCYADGSSK